MDKTPTGKALKLSCKGIPEPVENDTLVISQLNASSCPTSTPVKMVITESEDDDFYGSRYTQEMEVVWDWNSPKNNQTEKRKFRKLSNRMSPKTTFRRQPSNNNDQQQKLEKLKMELQALREQIAIPDNEASLQLSPREEAQIKEDIRSQSALDSLIEDENFNGDQDFEDIFNDSLDEQLVLCTQKVENVLTSGASKDLKGIEKSVNGSPSLPANLVSTFPKCSPLNTLSSPAKPGISDNNKILKPAVKVNERLNDSLDVVLESFRDEEIVLLSQTYEKKKIVSAKLDSQKSTIQRAQSDVQLQVNRLKTLPPESGKTEFFRTQSFELSNIIENQGTIPLAKQKEIERKRQEALARLQSKRKPENNTGTVHCSPDEIEKKRLQALARLEAKKKQELEIERKRKEALKRLELNRMKRAVSSKCIPTKRP